MKILKSSQIRELDAFTIQNEPINSIDLMERAAKTISNWIVENVSKEKKIKIFVGPGNNGGDGLAVARQLNKEKYFVEVFLLKISKKSSKDYQVNLDRLKTINGLVIKEIYKESDFPIVSQKDVVIDGLFGTGLTRKLDGLSKKLVQYLNNLNIKTIAIDIPSGLFSEVNTENDFEAIIKTDHTLTFQLPKLSFFFSENERFVGNWKVLPIGLNQEFIDGLSSEVYMIDNELVKSNLIKRKKFSHKGTYGHVLLVAGSYGKMGAAILAAKASLRTGSGLITVHVPKSGYEIIQLALPEAMTSVDWSEIIFTNISNVEDYTSIGIGPGIGVKQNTKNALANLLKNTTSPVVIDADGLNILSEQKELISSIPSNSILTPHPKEFERLVGKKSSNYEILNTQIKFSVENKLFVVLKGAHTSITCPDGSCYFNSTGNSGMATAGSGDVLTGIILSLLGQAYEPKYAAIIAVYLHGLSGDIASEKLGQEALIASDIIDNIGAAYLRIKEKDI